MRAWSLVVAILVLSLAPRAEAHVAPDPVTAALGVAAARLVLEPPATAFGEVQLLPLARLEDKAATALSGNGLSRNVLSTSMLSTSMLSASGGPVLAQSRTITLDEAVTRAARRPEGTRFMPALEDGRAYWYTAGAAAVTSLGARVLLSIPAYLVGMLGGLAFASNPAVATIVIIAAIAGFTVVDAAVSALVGTLTFNNVSRFYESDYWSGFAGQLAGNALSAGAFWLVFGFGGMLLGGLEFLSPFTIGGISSMLFAFSSLGVLPALVVTFLASATVPSLFGAWALSATARAREGFAIDPTWRPRSQMIDPVLPAERRLGAMVAVPVPGT